MLFLSTSSIIPTNPTASQLIFTLTNFYSQFNFNLSVDGPKYKFWRCIFLYMCKGEKVDGHINRQSKPKDDDDEDW